MTSITPIILATVIAVHDGDTFTVNLNCDIDIVCKSIPVRIRHIDTPEINGKCNAEKEKAQQAKLITAKYLAKGSTIVLTVPRRDKYFRLEAEFPALQTALSSAGLAHDYEGGKKVGWCD